MFYIDFPVGWYILFFVGLLTFVLASYLRKSFSGVARFGALSLVTSVFVELMGIGLNLWNYTGGNWPIILWPSYFLYSMAVYQIYNIRKK